MALVSSLPSDLAAGGYRRRQIKARGEGEEDVAIDSGDKGVGGGPLTCVELEKVGRRWCVMAAEMKDVDKQDDSWEDR